MQIKEIKIQGFRNFQDAIINFASPALIIGANDIGKSNLLYAIRLVLDRNLSDATIEPVESDFHISPTGTQEESFSIQVKLVNITEDAVISRLKGHLSDDGSTYFKYCADRKSLSYEYFIGHSEDSYEKIENRYSYLKNIHLKYIQSTRDLLGFIKLEKKHLLQIAKKERSSEDIESDVKKEFSIQKHIKALNKKVNSLSYVANATSSINDELSQLSLHNTDYTVKLEAKEVELSTYVEQLSLSAASGEKNIGIGGDGRNNQVLMALWKAKGEHEIDCTAEAVIYCVEEPEAHLHPHQQRKFAKYLVEKLKGQVIVTTHSPQIVEHFSPNKIIRLCSQSEGSIAASSGCSTVIDNAWNDFSYRMSIIPAEAFFADAVFLVEGPSEEIFYRALAQANDIDLDYLNISILQVGGISFKVYASILKAMNIRYVIRTDNDIVKSKKPGEWIPAGINRGRALIGLNHLPSENKQLSPNEIYKKYSNELQELKDNGIFISHCDLENDIAEVISDELCEYYSVSTTADAIGEMKKAKAISMYSFISEKKDLLADERFVNHDLFAPIQQLVDIFGFNGVRRKQ